MCVGRFTAGGSPDPTFGDSSGFARTGIMGEAFSAQAQAMVLDGADAADGGLCASGSPTNMDFCLARFQASDGWPSSASMPRTAG